MNPRLERSTEAGDPIRLCRDGKEFFRVGNRSPQESTSPHTFSKRVCGIGFGTAVGMGGETRDFEHSGHRSRRVEKAETALLLQSDFESFHEHVNAARGVPVRSRFPSS
jgi:hypothetical protein